MRIWDVDAHILCRKHLLGEHRELHALVTILSEDKKAYRHHPETKRWEGKLAALKQRHEGLVEEMTHRGYNHASPIEMDFPDSGIQTEFVDTLERQLEILKAKPCDCPLDAC